MAYDLAGDKLNLLFNKLILKLKFNIMKLKIFFKKLGSVKKIILGNI